MIKPKWTCDVDAKIKDYQAYHIKSENSAIINCFMIRKDARVFLVEACIKAVGFIKDCKKDNIYPKTNEYIYTVKWATGSETVTVKLPPENIAKGYSDDYDVFAEILVRNNISFQRIPTYMEQFKR